MTSNFCISTQNFFIVGFCIATSLTMHCPDGDFATPSVEFEDAPLKERYDFQSKNYRHAIAIHTKPETVSPSWWRKLSPTLSNIVDGLLKRFAPQSDIAVASSAMRSYARGADNIKNNESVQQSFTRLTTKQKENVANDWLTQAKAKYEKTDQGNLALRHEINAFTANMNWHMSGSEQLIAIENSTTRSIHFECIDMSKIDPTKSIEQQKQELKNQGIVTTRYENWFTNRHGSISDETLENSYGTWVSDYILQHKVPAAPLTKETIHRLTLERCGKPWNEINEKLRKSILVELNLALEQRQPIHHETSIPTEMPGIPLSTTPNASPSDYDRSYETFKPPVHIEPAMGTVIPEKTVEFEDDTN